MGGGYEKLEKKLTIATYARSARNKAVNGIKHGTICSNFDSLHGQKGKWERGEKSVANAASSKVKPRTLNFCAAAAKRDEEAKNQKRNEKKGVHSKKKEKKRQRMIVLVLLK